MRFLPEFDNILLGHDDRTRIVADAHRKLVYLPGLRVAATLLVDGVVGGAWTLESRKGMATVVVQPFAKLSKATRDAVTQEGDALAKFLEPEARETTVRVA